MTLVDPFALILIAAGAVVCAYGYAVRGRRSFSFSSGVPLKHARFSLKGILSRNLIVVKYLAFACAVIALSRPQTEGRVSHRASGVAIVLAVDCSSTMLAEDLSASAYDRALLVQERPAAGARTRLDVVKDVAKQFVASRPDDMMGVVAFAAQAYVVCPPTLDRDWLLSSIDRIKVGAIRDGTAIGSGIMSSLHALKNVRAASKVVVLLTDGINNYGDIPPLVAADAAKALGVKIYTIGVFSRGVVAVPKPGGAESDTMVIEIDETTLRKAAEATGGAYFRADDVRSLERGYREIDRLEKAPLEQSRFTNAIELYGFFASIALALILFEGLLRQTLLKAVP